MSEGVVAERYAQALFELGAESGQLVVLAEKIQAFASVYAESRQLRQTLENPVTGREQREAILAEVARRLGVPEVGVRGLLILARRRRLPVVPALARRLGELSDAKNGVVRAQVTTAQKMPEAYYEALERQLGASTSRKIVLSRLEDPSLIGGAVTRIGDSVIDSSLRGRLEQAEQKLMRALSNLSAG